tara:strand:- start:937 stop:2748 length:1812 start_codon:yes stop_codon:yes gene_type:complete
MKIENLLLTALTICTFFSTAQYNEKCATDYLHQKQLKNNPELQVKIKKNEANLQKFIQNQYFNFRSSEEILKVPLVLHIIHIGEAEGVGNNISNSQIESGIQQLNDAFRNVNGLGVDMGIEFALAIQDPNGASTNGIVRYDASSQAEYVSDGISTGTGPGLDEIDLKALSKWPKDQYYNIWIVSEINGNNGGFGTQGFAYLPGASAVYDGTVIQNTAWGDQGSVNTWNNLGTTIIHELGHGLGLYHTFHVYNDGDTTANGCPDNTDCSSQGDFCCDTDPHMQSSSHSCDTAEINQCTGTLLGNLVRNYMDYSGQECQVLFSPDQKDRMRGTLLTNRKSLLISRALEEPIAACIDPIDASCTPQTQTEGLSGNYAGIEILEIENKIISTSSFASLDGGYVDNTSECSVTAFLSPDSTYKVKVLPAGLNPSTSKIWIDYDNSGTFSDDELIFEGNHIGESYDSTNFTIPIDAVQNEFIRLRTSLDLLSITGPCYEPKYGQVEDHSVYIYLPGEVTSTANDNSSIYGLYVYPNPAESILSVQFDYDGSSEVQLFVRDLQGKLIKKTSLEGTQTISTLLNVSDFNNGIYNLSIQSKKEIVSQNFIVK